MKELFKPNFLQEIQLLRTQVHQQTEKELTHRKNFNPIPTEEELHVGAFQEQLEPQVRDAVFEFYRKGYPTYASGFTSTEFQEMDGFYSLNDESVSKLAALGVTVYKGWLSRQPPKTEETIHTALHFRPVSADLASIKEQWDAIAATLPDCGQLTRASGTKNFTLKYAPERIDIEQEELERVIEVDSVLGTDLEMIPIRKKRLAWIQNALQDPTIRTTAIIKSEMEQKGFLLVGSEELAQGNTKDDPREGWELKSFEQIFEELDERYNGGEEMYGNDAQIIDEPGREPYPRALVFMKKDLLIAHGFREPEKL